MILWHVGATLAIVRTVFRDPKMDLRFLAAGALLPDLIDKGVVLFFDRFRNGRIFAHTLAFSVLLMAGVMVSTRRGTPARKAWLGLPIGSLVHLLLDGMWTVPQTFWWPLFGWSFPLVSESYWADFLGRLARNPVVLAEEALGLAYLIYLWRQGGLSDPGRRAEFLHSGRLAL